jgi:apolipoprotein N-acyltransferase
LLRARLFLAVPVPVLLLGSVWFWGVQRLAEDLPPSDGAVVRLVQPNAEQQDKWDPDRARMFFQRQLDFTAAAPRPDLVIWPETAVPWLLDRTPELAPIIAEAAGGATVVLGVQRSEGMRFWNSMAVIAADGAVRAIYDKHHLVPFGEYVPLVGAWASERGLAGLAARVLSGYTPGPGPQVLDLGAAGRVLPLICYESIFPRHAHTTPRADWILQITNDGWFGDLTGPYQHLAQARLRAVEQGLPVIRVANTGVSAVIDARGAIVAHLPLGADAYLDAAVPGALAATAYSRWGDTPLWAALVLLFGVALKMGRRNRA